MPFSQSSVIEFYDNLFCEKTPDNKTENNYSSIEQIYIVENTVIYIYVNNIMAYIIPKKSFESESQYESFIEFLKKKNICVNTVCK